GFLALQFPGAAQESGAERGAAEAFEDGGPDDQIGDAGLVLDGDEDDAVGAAWTLPDQHDPRDREPPVNRQMGELSSGNQALASGTHRLRQDARARRAPGRSAAPEPPDSNNRFPGPRRAAPRRPRQTLLSGATRDAAPNAGNLPLRQCRACFEARPVGAPQHE